MAAILVTSLRPRAGKTTLAAGLARCLQEDGLRATSLRLHGGDPTAAAAVADARLYALLSAAPASTAEPLDLQQAAAMMNRGSKATALLLEDEVDAAGGQLRNIPGARTVVVLRYEESGDSARIRSAGAGLGEAFLGLVVTAVPGRRADEAASALANAGLPCLGLMPEDQILASFTIAQMSKAIAAEPLIMGDLDRVVARVVVGPVSADPGRDYFAHYQDVAVITRSHKPDLQLAALDAGAVCLIVVGGQPPLQYVASRAQDEGVPVLLTGKSTLEVAQALEETYGRARFDGNLKVDRAAELVRRHLDYQALMHALGLR